MDCYSRSYQYSRPYQSDPLPLTAFINKHDGAGQSTKSKTQALLMPKRFQKDPNVLPEAGEIGTNKGTAAEGERERKSVEQCIHVFL